MVKPGTLFTDIVAGEDWMPTLLAAAGEPGIKEKLLQGHKAGDKTFKVHLDGYNQTRLSRRAKAREDAARSSSISVTTATCSPCATSA